MVFMIFAIKGEGGVSIVDNNANFEPITRGLKNDVVY